MLLLLCFLWQALLPLNNWFRHCLHPHPFLVLFPKQCNTYLLLAAHLLALLSTSSSRRRVLVTVMSLVLPFVQHLTQERTPPFSSQGCSRHLPHPRSLPSMLQTHLFAFFLCSLSWRKEKWGTTSLLLSVLSVAIEVESHKRKQEIVHLLGNKQKKYQMLVLTVQNYNRKRAELETSSKIRIYQMNEECHFHRNIKQRTFLVLKCKQQVEALEKSSSETVTVNMVGIK